MIISKNCETEVSETKATYFITKFRLVCIVNAEKRKIWCYINKNKIQISKMQILTFYRFIVKIFIHSVM